MAVLTVTVLVIVTVTVKAGAVTVIAVTPRQEQGEEYAEMLAEMLVSVEFVKVVPIVLSKSEQKATSTSSAETYQLL